MLQCVLTGRAQEAYSTLSATDCKVYKRVKSAVLKAYELVPEAYRQRFRSWKRGDKCGVCVRSDCPFWSLVCSVGGGHV